MKSSELVGIKRFALGILFDGGLLIGLGKAGYLL